MPVQFKQRTALEFFAGIGLARMGLEKAGWRVVYSNDIDPKKKAMFEGHWGSASHYDLRSVFDVDADALPSAELAWASFPCVDLSLAGNRRGLRGSHSSAYWGFHRVIRDLQSRQPRFVVLENVPGLITSSGGADLREVVLSLNDLGYAVDIALVDAVRFVPQSRQRLFLIGRLSGRGTAVPCDLLSPLRPPRVMDFIYQNPDLVWDLLPIQWQPSRRPSLDETLEWFPSDADIWWSEDQTERLLAQMSHNHLRAVKQLANLDSPSFGTVYRRVRASGCRAEVRLDGVAGCLRTPRGGSSKQFVLQMSGGSILARNMTAVEYARLQGAPDFNIRVGYNQALFGFGDAVCVPVVTWVVSNLLELE